MFPKETFGRGITENSRIPLEAQSHEVLPLYTNRVVANRYQILSKLGMGGMGEVWHAFDQKLRVDVALKSIRSDQQKNQEWMEALRNEVRIAREVISPNVCRIFDLVVDEDQELISMEYIDGATLLTLLVQKGALELKEARDIAAQFLAGLEAIHQAGLIHRDLKPENIMITRTGRVVVMDFGIAKYASQINERVSGTPHFLSPEELAGKAGDARSDVYSAGVVLAEMTHPDGILSHETREEIWNAVREDPTRLADGPWKSVITKAVATDPQHRFISAEALSRALEEATQIVEAIEEQNPFPGLAAFASSDSQYFFGRELEIETVIKKIQQLQLLAVVGPSGAGKTSFLRAGLVPALPAGWSSLFCVPGDSPFVNLRQALFPDYSNDSKERKNVLGFEDPGVALRLLLNHWRRKHSEGLLIIDRFEELFTLNSPEVQTSFVNLISTAAIESDVRVLLCMRDDFLLRCNDFPALAPIFSELTPFGKLAGPALRRALVQPALKCGYRFEDESLIDEILSDVEKERGALPLMAFAATKLWEKRKKESGLLTRKAYKEIGGVEGALAQHAEETMERIGSDKHTIVREIFRNLITSQNTRAARDKEELLTIFPEKNSAEEVLRALIDARLLTSFEAPQAENEKSKASVEIIHESLLSAWPRLVRWQTQDADSAQLRDQLRQAAQLWEHRNRSKDLLWTGAAYLDYQAWRQRYPGGLTAIEEAFAQAMLHRATKQRRQRRIALSTIFVVLLAIIAVITSFWRQANVSKNEAVSQARSAQASKFLALGRSLAGADTSTKLAYAISSLELSYSAEARHFALQSLATAPPAIMQDIPDKPINSFKLSPDGNWMAIGFKGGGFQLCPRDGKTPIILSKPFAANNIFIPWSAQFSADGKFLIWTIRKDTRIVKVLSMTEKKVIRTFTLEGTTVVLVRGADAYFITDGTGSRELPASWSKTIIRKWSFNSSEPKIIARLQFDRIWWKSFDVDSRGRWFVYANGKNFCVKPLNGSGPEKTFGPHPTGAAYVKFRPNSDEFASTDVYGLIQLWSISSNKPIRTMNANGELGYIWFDPTGKDLYASRDNALYRWDLSAPPDADPFIFRLPGGVNSIDFDTKNQWLIVADGSSFAYVSLRQPYPYVLRGTGFSGSRDVRFTPDGKSILNGFIDDGSGVLRWGLPGEKQLPSRDFWNKKKSVTSIDVDPLQKFVLAGTYDKVRLISLADQKVSELEGPEAYVQDVAFSKDGKYAAASLDSRAEDCGIRVWELGTSNSWLLDQSKGKVFFSLEMPDTNNIFAGDTEGNLYHWNSLTGPPKILRKGEGAIWDLAISPDSELLAVNRSFKTGTSELVLLGLKNDSSMRITSYGNKISSVGFDSTGKLLITGDLDGNVRVGKISDAHPYLLIGHESSVEGVAVHPSGNWIASTEGGRPTVRLWRMPHGESIASLTDRDFLARLKNLTNVRIVPDKNSSNGYKIEYAPFPKLDQAPIW